MRSDCLLAMLVIGAACADRPDVAPEPPRPAGLEVLAPLATEGVRVSLVQADGDLLMLRVEARDIALGSVQGLLKFDPADFEVLEATGATAAQVVVNMTGAAGGTLRFAAFEATGVPSGDLLRLRIKVHRSLAASRPAVRLEAAGTVEGMPFSPAQLVGTEGVYRDPR